MKTSSKWGRIGLVFLVAALDLILGPGMLFLLKSVGVPIYSAAQAEDHLAAFLLQCLLVSLWPGLLLLLSWRKLGKSFPEVMGLSLHWRFQRRFVGILVILLVILAGLAVRRGCSVTQSLIFLFYYLVFVAFAEEFLFRGICAHLLQGFPWQVVFLLPSFLFAMLHLFAWNGFAPLTTQSVLAFLRYGAFGLMASGCCFQFLREWSGTLWVPVLLHAILDFSAVLNLYP